MLPILQKQRSFFDSNITLSYEFRIKALKLLKAKIISYQSSILDALYKDLNKSEVEAIFTELWFTLSELDDTIKHLKQWMKKKNVKTPIVNWPGKSYRIASPLGMTLIISPWNYPFQLTMCPLIAAIAAGNTVVVKPSQNSKNTSDIIKTIIQETFEEDHIAFFEGNREQADLLIRENFDHIFFTGSKAVGQKIIAASSQYLPKVSLELGGKSPCIVEETAHIDTSAKRIVFGKATNSGQTCIAPDYIICHSSIKQQLIERLIFYFNQFYEQHFLDNPNYGKIISEHHFNRLVGLLKTSQVIYGGVYDVSTQKIEPTLVEGLLNTPIMQEEIFGPILPIITYTEKQEIKRIIDFNPNPLALYIFSNNNAFINDIHQTISFGGGSVNDTLAHVVGGYMPFGGIKDSGNSQYHGYDSFVTFSHIKSIYRRQTKFDLPVKFPPYTNRITKLIKSLFIRKV